MLAILKSTDNWEIGSAKSGDDQNWIAVQSQSRDKDAETRSVTIFRPNSKAETRSDILSIAGEGPVAGFVLNLVKVWEPFQKA